MTFEEQLLKLQEEESIERQEKINVEESDVLKLLGDMNKLLQEITETFLNKKTMLLEEAKQIGAVEVDCIRQLGTILGIMNSTI